MEFLVSMRLELGREVSEEHRADLRAAEVGRAAELARLGLLRRLWRVPGEPANYGLWEAADASELHDALTSLPLSRWMTMRVTPLARHPNDPIGAETA